MEQERKTGHRHWLALLVVVAAIGALAVLFPQSTDHATGPPTAPGAVPMIEPAIPVPVPDQPPLPALDASDAWVLAQLTGLLGSDGWMGRFISDQAVRRLVALVDNLADGRVVSRYLPFPSLEQRFPVHPSDPPDLQLDPAGYHRFDGLGQLATRVNPDSAAWLYRRFYPLLQEAYQDLGYPDREFHARFQQALGMLAEAPVIEGPIRLVRPKVLYDFADPELQALPPLHRQMLRMGPENTRAIQAAARALSHRLATRSE